MKTAGDENSHTKARWTTPKFVRFAAQDAEAAPVTGSDGGILS